MKISIKYTGNIINLPSNVVDFIKDAEEHDLKFIVGLSSFSTYFNDFDTALPILSEKLGLELCEVSRAIEFWSDAGVIDVDGSISCDTVASFAAYKNSAPSYTGEQILKIVDSNPGFKSLADCAQNVLEKDFTQTDFNSLLYLKDFYKFSDEYIIMLLNYCKELESASWAYIRKIARLFYDEGIDTYEVLEKHLSQRKDKRSLEYKVRKLFGVGMREFTKRERDIFDGWVGLKLSYDLIKRAYEISVDNGKGANWQYTNKILENWNISGVKTLEDAEKTIAKNKSKLSMSTFDTDDFFEAALKRSNELFEERSKE